MAEQVRSIFEILKELFSGKDSALEKYARVRMTQYEMMLWRNYHLPLSSIPRATKTYFSKRFLKGVQLFAATDDELKEGLTRLGHAVDDGCKKRCTRLVEELNDALMTKGLPRVEDVDSFLNWLTFSYKPRVDVFGIPIYEPGYGFPLLVFDSDRNRKEFWGELRLLLESKKMISMKNVCKIVLAKRKVSVPI